MPLPPAGWQTGSRMPTMPPLPQAAQQVLNETETITLETDVLTISVNELLCDGKIAYLTAEAKPKNEGTAILYPDCATPDERIGEELAKKLNHVQVNAKTSYAEAAKLTGLPLYCVDTELKMPNTVSVESGMMDGSLLENGHLLLVRMLYFKEVPDTDALPVTITARLNRVDLETLEFAEGSRQVVEIHHSLPIHGVTARRSYSPVETAKLSGRFVLTGVEAKQTCAGVYITLKTKADAPMTLDEFFEINDEWDVVDENGNRLPTGISLTGEWLDGNDQPFNLDDNTMIDELHYLMMISAEALPESFIVTDGTVQIPVK